MEAFKVLACVVLVLGCALAEPIPEKSVEVEVPSKQVSNGEESGLVQASAEESPVVPADRVKKAAPLYPYYPYNAYPYSSSYYYPQSYYQPYSYGYSYSGQDDGKYYPGKYEKASYYPRNNYYYPQNYYQYPSYNPYAYHY